MLSIPPVTGFILSAWAIMTRKRSRRAGFSNYYDV
jgi:hypothetical protein